MDEYDVMTETNEVEETSEPTPESGTFLVNAVAGGLALTTLVVGGVVIKSRHKISAWAKGLKAKKLDRDLEKAREKVTHLEAEQAKAEAEKE